MQKLLWATIGFGACLSAQAAIQYRVTLLENPIDAYAYAPLPTDISDSGWVVGLAASAGGPPYFGAQVMWQSSPQGGYQVLGTYPGYHLSARAVNNSGQSAVYAMSATSELALRYTPGLGFFDLGNLGGTGSESQNGATGINSQGQVTGFSDVPSGTTHAFRYTDGAGMQDLGSLSLGYSHGYDINDSGWVTGRSQALDGGDHAFLYRDQTGMQDLGPGIGVSINNLGMVAGVSPLFGGPVLFKDGQVVPMGSIPGMQGVGIGSINDVNVVVGGYLSADSHALAFMATESGGMVDLNTLIDPSSGWLLAGASAINNLGQIVGEGYLEGRATAYRLDPIPEPSTWALLVLGGSLLLWRGRRKP